MLKKLISNIALGFSLGIIIGDGIVMLSGWVSSGRLIVVSGSLLGKTNEEIILAFIIQSLLSGLYGALAFGGVIFYEIERIPLALATGLHCLLVVVPFVPLSLFLGWGGGDIVTILIMAACQLVAFFIIWLIMYTIYKKKVKELNEIQNSLKRMNKSRS